MNNAPESELILCYIEYIMRANNTDHGYMPASVTSETQNITAARAIGAAQFFNPFTGALLILLKTINH